MPYLSATGLMILKLSFVFINSEQFKEKRTVSVILSTLADKYCIVSFIVQFKYFVVISFIGFRI